MQSERRFSGAGTEELYKGFPFTVDFVAMQCLLSLLPGPIACLMQFESQ